MGKGRFGPRHGRSVPASLRECAVPPEVAVSQESVTSVRAAGPELPLVPSLGFCGAYVTPQQLRKAQARQCFPARAGAYRFTSYPAGGSERLNVTACVCVRVYRVGDRIRTALHAPPTRRPNSGLRKAVRFPRHCCPRRRRGMGRKEAAAAVFLALRSKPLYPLLPLLVTVAAPCPGSHSHILLPCRGHAVARSGSAAPDQVAPLQDPRRSCGPGWRAFQGCPRHRCAVVKGELGTGASRSRTYLGTQSHRRPEGQSHARGPGNTGRT